MIIEWQPWFLASLTKFDLLVMEAGIKGVASPVHSVYAQAFTAIGASLPVKKVEYQLFCSLGIFSHLFVVCCFFKFFKA